MSKNFIDIPFGASDSELRGFEYTIPEGMEAEIKDGKVIIRQKETEDERVVGTLYWLAKTTHDWVNGVTKGECISWLLKQKDEAQRQFNLGVQAGREDALYEIEKQKEQSFTHHEIDESLQDAVTHQMEDDGDVDDFIRRGIDGIILKYAELGARWQKEQKPAEWSEEDEEKLKLIIAGNYLPLGLREWICGLPEKIHAAQSKEELAKMLQDEYNKGKEVGEKEGYIKGYDGGYKAANESKSFHFPDMPTMPSGFGCDGTHCTNPQMDCINCPRRGGTGKYITLPNSAYGESELEAHWKPSEEQMQWLESAVKLSTDKPEIHGIIISLYEQLKRL